MIKIKRTYEKASREDGVRVLVDRLWPRCVKKADLRLDEWLKEMGPFNKLRKWFNHDPMKWEEFRKRYLKELRDKTDLIKHLRTISRKRKLTLLYSARDMLHNQAEVIREYLKNKNIL